MLLDHWRPYRASALYDTPYNPDFCPQSVQVRGRGISFHQCNRTGKYPWTDSDGVVWTFCKQHHPDEVAKRKQVKNDRYKAQQQRSRDTHVARALREATEDASCCSSTSDQVQFVSTTDCDSLTSIGDHAAYTDTFV